MKCLLEFQHHIFDNGKPFNIIINNKTYSSDSPPTIFYELNFNYSTEINQNLQHKIFTLKNFTPGLGQRMTITGIKVNGKPYYNFYSFCYFQMENNLYVDNTLKHNATELCFNGNFIFSIEDNINQFLFFPYYYSKQPNDWVSNNVVMECKNPFGCLHGDGDVKPHIESNVQREEPHTNLKYFNEPYSKEFIKGENIDILCLGCSVTQGKSVNYDHRWCTLLQKLSKSRVGNFAVPAAGSETILNNLQCAIKDFKVKKVVILLPNLERQLIRWQWDNLYFNLPTVYTDNDHSGTFYTENFWATISQIANQLKQKTSKKDKEVIQSNKKAIIDIINLCRNKSVELRISSWDPIVYKWLKLNTSKKELLTFFQKIDIGTGAGPTESYPGPRSHSYWIEKNFNQIVTN